MSHRKGSRSLQRESGAGDQSASGSPVRRRSLQVVATFGIGKAVPGLITFACVPVWLAVFGTQNYAVYSLYWAVSLIGTSLMTGWIRQAILRYAGAAGMEYERVRKRTRWLLEASPVVMTLPVAFLATAMVDGAVDRLVFLVIAAVSLLCQSRYAIVQVLLQRDARSGNYAAAEIVRTAGTLLLSLIFAAVVGATPWAIVAASGIATFGALLIASLGRSGIDSVCQRTSREVVVSYWRFGWPMSLWLTASASLIYLDRFVVTALFGLHRAGQYAAAADMVVRGMGLIVAPVIMFLHPALMRAWNTEARVEALRRWKRATSGLAVGILAAAALAFFGYLMVGDSLLGSPVTPGTFGTLALGGAAWQLALMAHKPLEATGRTVTMLLGLAASVGLTLLLDFFLARPLAELGVAIASLGGAIFYIATVLFLNARSTPAVLRNQRMVTT